MILDYTWFSVGRMPFRYLSIPLSGTYLRVANYEPLLDKVSKTVLAWSSLNLSYAGRVEIVKSVVQGIQSFWLGVLPIPAVVLDRIIRMCRRFIWTGNFAIVAWKTMLLEKEHGGLGLRDTRKWNDALLSKALWNMHCSKETMWCRWIHQYYSKRNPIWRLQPQRDYPPLLKRLLLIRNTLV